MSTVHMNIKCKAIVARSFFDTVAESLKGSTVADFEYDELDTDKLEELEHAAENGFSFYGDHDPIPGCETDAKKFVAFEGEIIFVTVNFDGDVMTDVICAPGMRIVIAPENEIRYFQLLRKVEKLFGEEE